MRIDKRYKLEKAAEKGGTRPVLQALHLDAEEAHLYALDGFILAIVPVEVEPGDKSGPIPLDALVQARKRAGKNQTAEIIPNTTAAVPDYAEYERPTFAKEPPRPAKLWPEDEPVARVGLNAAKLHALAQALGNDSVELQILPTKNGLPQAYIVKPLSGSEARGLLMPIKLAE